MHQIQLKKHFKNTPFWFYEQVLCQKQREPILRQIK